MSVSCEGEVRHMMIRMVVPVLVVDGDDDDDG